MPRRVRDVGRRSRRESPPAKLGATSTRSVQSPRLRVRPAKLTSLALPTLAPSRPAPLLRRRREAYLRGGLVQSACRVRSARSSGGPQPRGRRMQLPPRPTRDDERCPHALHRVSRVARQRGKRSVARRSRAGTTAHAEVPIRAARSCRNAVVRSRRSVRAAWRGTPDRTLPPTAACADHPRRMSPSGEGATSAATSCPHDPNNLVAREYRSTVLVPRFSWRTRAVTTST